MASHAIAARPVALVLRDPQVDRQQVASDQQMRELSELLWAYGFEVIDTVRSDGADDLARVVPQFERKIGTAGISLLYYAGAARGPTGTAIATSTSGARARGAPEMVVTVLDNMQRQGARGVVLLDLVKRRSAAPSQPAAVADIAAIKNAGSNLLLTFIDTDESRALRDGLPLKSSLMRMLGAPVGSAALPLVRLASLVKEDVSFVSGGLDVPWVVGSLKQNTDVRRLPAEEVQQLQLTALDDMLTEQRCTGDSRDDRVRSAAVEFLRQSNRSVPNGAGLRQLASADVIYDMLWILRSSRQAGCPFERVAVVAPPLPRRPAVAPDDSSRESVPPRPRKAIARPDPEAEAPSARGGSSRSERASVRREREAADEAPRRARPEPRQQQEAPSRSNGSGRGGGGGSFAPAPI